MRKFRLDHVRERVVRLKRLKAIDCEEYVALCHCLARYCSALFPFDYR